MSHTDREYVNVEDEKCRGKKTTFLPDPLPIDLTIYSLPPSEERLEIFDFRKDDLLNKVFKLTAIPKELFNVLDYVSRRMWHESFGNRPKPRFDWMV